MSTKVQKPAIFHRIKRAGIFAALLIGTSLLVSCERDAMWDELNPDERRTKLEGMWQSIGYGYVADIKDGLATCYDVTSSTCLKRSTSFGAPGFNVTDWDVRLNSKGTEFIIEMTAIGAEIKFKRLNILPTVCEEGGVAPSAIALQNFDVLWQTFKEQYAFFELRGVDWEQARANYRAQVNEDNLFDVLVEMLSVFKEDHVSLTTTDNRSFEAGLGPLLEKKFYQDYLADGAQGSFEEYIAEQQAQIFSIITDKYLNGQFKTGANGKVFWGILSSEIGYLQIVEMSALTDPFDIDAQLPVIKSVMDEAMHDLKNCKGVVLDVRVNGGGLILVALEIAGRFASKTYPVLHTKVRNGNDFFASFSVTLKPTSKLPFTGPVVVLTSNFTASAAEYFTTAMKQLPRVKIVGENTNGIFSSWSKELPNGWVFNLWNEIVTTAQGKVYEKVGIPPDIEVPLFPLQERKQSIDAGIEKAVEILSQ